MDQPRSDDPPTPEGSAGWDALPPDGELTEDDAAEDDAAEDERPDRPRS